MEKNRFIFDLDNTLLIPTFYEDENEYFKSCLTKEETIKFLSKKVELLESYEKKFPKYDNNLLSEFLSKKSGIDIAPYMIANWRYISSISKSKIIEGVIPTLEYLKGKNKSIAILTNWFRENQEDRIKKAGLFQYIDDIYGGDEYLKPNPKSYIQAAGKYDISECVMIGDDLIKDVYGANCVGMSSILYDPENKESKKVMIKRIDNINKVKEMY